MNFILSPDAAQDLKDIWQYIAEDNLDAADRFLEKLYDEIRSISRNPGIGHRREDLAGDRVILFLAVGNYLILYRTAKPVVEIVAVVHGKRDVPSFLRRRRV